MIAACAVGLHLVHIPCIFAILHQFLRFFLLDVVSKGFDGGECRL